MELEQVAEQTKKKPSIQTKKPGNAVKKLSPEAVKNLQSLKDKANKKDWGTRVRDSDIIAKALSLLEAKHIKELQEATMTEKDRLNLAHKAFQEKNGKCTVDQFIGKLLSGEVKSEHT